MTGFRGILLSSILYINLCLQIHHISAQTYLGYSCTGGTSTPAFEANLNTIISSVSTNINPYGFYNGTTGVGADQVNAIALCRGDVDVGMCIKCVRKAARSLTTKNCPNVNEALTWYDECMFRYSNNPILGIMSLNPAYLQVSVHAASNVTLFTQEMRSFAGKLVNAAYKGTFRKYSGQKISLKNEKTVYGFMQCTPDITPSDCKSCLNSIADDVSGCCYGFVGAKYITPSCSFRYEIYPFLNKL